MDIELCYLITKLNTCILTHPNIVKLWKYYLNKKIERLNDSTYNVFASTYSDSCGYEYYINRQVENLNTSMSRCNNAIEIMTHTNDLTPQTLLIILALQTTLQNNIT